MGIEFELKFRATPETLKAIDTEITGDRAEFSMHTTYYDTPDGDLSARRYTLRQRMENHTAVCTLKFPAGEDGRGEFELESADLKSALPELCKLSGLADLPALLEKGIVPVCGAKFHRTAITVKLPDCTLEWALDQGILYGGGRETPLCEVEIELKDGAKEAAIAYAALMADRFRLTGETGSKFRRALALARGE